MKRLWLIALTAFAAGLLSGADLVLKDFAGKKLTGTVKWQKTPKGLILIHGEMQGGEIRLPLSIDILKNYKYIIVDRRHQSGNWSVGFLNKDVRETVKPLNPGDTKINFPISAKMAADS